MSDLKPSIRATYDSAETGPRYHVTTYINGRVVGEFHDPIPDPFVRQMVQVGLWDILRGLRNWALRRPQLEVEVVVGADPELMYDVLELDGQTLIAGRTRAAAFRQSLHGKLARFGGEA